MSRLPGGLGLPDVERFDIATDVEIWQEADNLRQATLTQTRAQLEELQMVYGYTFNKDGLLADRQGTSSFRPAGWVHHLRFHAHPCLQRHCTK